MRRSGLRVSVELTEPDTSAERPQTLKPPAAPSVLDNVSVHPFDFQLPPPVIEAVTVITLS